jgi:hypothetical protein
MPALHLHQGMKQLQTRGCPAEWNITGVLLNVIVNEQNMTSICGSEQGLHFSLPCRSIDEPNLRL